MPALGTAAAPTEAKIAMQTIKTKLIADNGTYKFVL